MPLPADDQERVNEGLREAAHLGKTGILVHGAIESQKLGPVTVACTIFNRTIGSGIYVTPAIVLKSTNSVGISLLLWALGSVAGMSALLIWLELGLSVPKFEVPNRDSADTRRDDETEWEPVPRNGGEKNYLEFIYKRAGSKKHLRTTCMFAVIYVILGNLSGNAIAFGIYVLEAAGIDGHAAAVRGLAVACLTVACLLHASWRKGGIFVNNTLAILKILILLVIIGIGFAASAGASFGHGSVHGETVNPTMGTATSNFDTHTSFAHSRKDTASYADSILFIVYTFSGYEQPFYVLSEVHQPKRKFAKSTITAMGLIGILFMLVNVAYLCAVSFDQRLEDELDMATVFFKEVFGNDLAPRVMSGIIALSIFGNIVVMTFTASRVKQEIAKEGVLPWSLFFARSTTTPIGRLINHFWPSNLPDAHVEQSPAPALFLHWIFSMLMIGATSSKLPDVAYGLLVSLYSYTVVVLIGFFVASGLLYLRYFSEGNEWTAGSGFKPWGGPTAAIIYSITCAFLLVAAFLPPSAGSYFAKSSTGIEWYIVPTVGLSASLLGYAYYLLFEYLIPSVTKKVLVVDRDPTIVCVDGEWVQAFETVEACWEARSGPGNGSPETYNTNHEAVEK